MSLQTPPLQPAKQKLPQVPQLSGSLLVSVQTPPQQVPLQQLTVAHDSPSWAQTFGAGPTGAGWQNPSTQTSSAVQQMPRHSVVPSAQTHDPAEQTRPAGQTNPHKPQLLTSSPPILTQTPPQSDCPSGQAGWSLQVPLSQAPPQLTPQAPQLAVSVCRSTQSPPQAVCPAGHSSGVSPGARQRPLVQTCSKQHSGVAVHGSSPETQSECRTRQMPPPQSNSEQQSSRPAHGAPNCPHPPASVVGGAVVAGLPVPPLDDPPLLVPPLDDPEPLLAPPLVPPPVAGLRCPSEVAVACQSPRSPGWGPVSTPSTAP